MTSALLAAPTQPRVVVRPAPRREPPFDDEISDPLRQPRPYDQRLPFELPVPRRPAWPARPSLRRGLPDPAAWTRRLLIGMVEAAAGRRPLHQLAAMVSPGVLRGLGADFERAATTGDPHWLHRATVRTIRGCEPVDGVAEICATVEAGRRVRAVALRLEEQHGRWRCTRLQLG
jgi:hypothetical protein